MITLQRSIDYLAATRPPFLIASAVPVAIGIAAAAADGITIDGHAALLTLTGALLAHAAINLDNDYHDDLNGTDRINQRRIHPFTGGSRMIQDGRFTRQQIGRFALSLYLATALTGLLLSWLSTPLLLLYGLAGLLVGWGYSAPPLRLNSRGLGELSVALGFGLLITGGSDLVQRGWIEPMTLLIATPYGLLTTALLYINQFPDHDADAASGKRHWVVRLGPQRAGRLYLPLVSAAYLLTALLIAIRELPIYSLTALLPLPLSLYASHQLRLNAGQPERLRPAIIATLLALKLHGVTIALTLWIGY